MYVLQNEYSQPIFVGSFEEAVEAGNRYVTAFLDGRASKVQKSGSSATWFAEDAVPGDDCIAIITEVTESHLEYSIQEARGKNTLKRKGTPWAELYRGSGRLTGHLSAEPVRMDTGEVAPDWTWVGDMTEAEFFDQFDHEVHDQFHTPERAEWSCSFCEAAGWVESNSPASE